MSKNQKLAYYRKLIYDIGLCLSLKTNHNDVYHQLMELFKNHPEYPSKFENVVDVAIVENKLIKKYFELQLIKSDGRIDNVSYKACIYKQSKDSNLKNAMRYAIINQILEYRNTCDKLVCEMCRSEQNIQIDHVIQFKQLYNNFLLQNTVPVPTQFDDNYYNSAMFKDDDFNFENSWYEYHKNHCILRCLCSKCNLTRNKK